jgi:hypothetical protein
MDLEAQRDLLKRILKYVRRNHTIYQKDYIRATEEKKSQAMRSFTDGMAQAYLELITYMEGLLKDFDEAIEAQPVEEDDEVSSDS